MCTDQKFQDTMTNCVMGSCTIAEFMGEQRHFHLSDYPH